MLPIETRNFKALHQHVGVGKREILSSEGQDGLIKWGAYVGEKLAYDSQGYASNPKAQTRM